jgi:dihydropteroate synthase
MVVESKLTKIVGIVNVTPDSFSDGGKYLTIDSAINQIYTLIEEGAHIIDIGAQSTKPDAELLSFDSEISRLRPLLRELHYHHKQIKFSIDTDKVEVAQFAYYFGASIINAIDCSDAMCKFVARERIPLVVTHHQGLPAKRYGQYSARSVGGVVADVYNWAVSWQTRAREGGVDLIIDPGFGFSKNAYDNSQLLWAISQAHGVLNSTNFGLLGLPIMSGHSRKTFLEKDAVVHYLTSNCDYVRVHSPKEFLRCSSQNLSADFSYDEGLDACARLK